MRRHADSNNLIILIVLLDYKRIIALITVSCEQLVATKYYLFCILVKVLQLLQPKLICYLAVLRDCNNLILGSSILLILGGELIAALKDNKE